MSTNSAQQTGNTPQKPTPKKRRRKNREFHDMLGDFLERTGLNEDFEAAVAHVTRFGMNSFWKTFQPGDVAIGSPTGEGPSSQAVDPDSPYAVLGVHENTPPEIVRAVYLAWVKNHHPDVGGDPEKFKKINVAYDQIKRESSL
jgi:hypothetical protein